MKNLNYIAPQQQPVVIDQDTDSKEANYVF